MDWITSFLLFAVFFYVMMRFGCGSHAVHGYHQQHASQSEAGDTKDPVCGIKVGADSHYAEVYQGREYRFCSRNCLDKFDAEPQHFSEQGRASA
jgi:YHS domain-containing protein